MNTSDSSLPPAGTELTRALDALVSTFEQMQVRYALIGGIAVIQHGRVRTTIDIDALIDVPRISQPRLFGALAQQGFSVDLDRNLRELLDDGITSTRYGSVPVDLLRPVLPALAHVLDRSTQQRMIDREVRVSSVEGLIVMKLMAMRAQDEADIRDLLISHHERVDLAYIRAELNSFAVPSDHRHARFESLLAEARNPN